MIVVGITGTIGSGKIGEITVQLQNLYKEAIHAEVSK